MYIVFICILLVLVILFWDAINIMLKTMSNSNLENGYLWFFCLLAMNILIISFIVGFYYYKSTQLGNNGVNGAIGYPGIDGNVCNITIPCYKQNQ